MKAILFVILNVSVCFPRGSVGVQNLDSRGGLGGRTKKISRLAIARHDPPCKTTFNFYPAWRAFVLVYCNREVKADVKSTLCHDQTPAIEKKLMRVQNGVLENESISSIAARPDASQQVSE